MTETFFTSDLHLGHANVAFLRGFASPEAHDAEIVRRWNATVSPDATVWVLGDVAMKFDSGVRRTARSLNGAKHLIWGNHDAGHPMHRTAHNAWRQFVDYGQPGDGPFLSAAASARRKLPTGDYAVLSHFPYERDRGAVRHAQWRLRDEGLWLFHGHTHGRERVTLDRGHTEFHVGLDAWDLAPVSMACVLEEMETSAVFGTSTRALEQSRPAPAI